MVFVGYIISIALYAFNVWLIFKRILPGPHLKRFEKIFWTVLLLLLPFIGLFIYTSVGRPAAKRFDPSKS